MLDIDKYTNKCFDLLLLCNKLDIDFKDTHNKLQNICKSKGFVLIKTEPFDYYCIVEPVISQNIFCYDKYRNFFKNNLNEINKEFNTFIVSVQPLSYEKNYDFHKDLYLDLKVNYKKKEV